ncbi:ABC transporter substrate binding protein, partial [Aliivibrio kagoshimensis]|uniref:ABC transporter substrate binding protein n=1 Tax=Aliivibrio kagoshimensis TaxID=2910230 RepID=UPI003D0C35C9
NYFEQLYALFNVKYNYRQLDLIMAIDNDAYHFIMSERETLFPGIPVVFAGYNGFNEKTTLLDKQVTGVIEENAFEETIDVALQLHPNTEKVVFVLPNNPKKRQVWIEGLPQRLAEQVDFINVTANTLKGIDQQLAALGSNIVVIPLNSFQQISGEYLEFNKLVQHLANTGNYPIYGLWDVILGDGIVGGKLVSSEMQGQSATKLAIKILNGHPVETLPINKSSPNQYMFDWQQLKRFNIDMTDLPYGSVVIKVPESFYEKYTLLVWLVASIILILVGLLITSTVHFHYRKQAENNLRIAGIAFESQEGMVVTDANYRILRVNAAFSKITGYSDNELIGKSPNILKTRRNESAIYDEIWNNIRQTDYWEGDIDLQKKNGDVYTARLTISAVKDLSGEITSFVSTQTDITESKQDAEKIRKLAFYDPLTLLPNRRLLYDRLNSALSVYHKNASGVSLLFLDIDNFKVLNDTLGHNIGDVLLKKVAERLSLCIRDSDSLARIGGDEFVIILDKLAKQPTIARQQTQTVAEKILTELSKPFQLENHKYTTSVSIGSTLLNEENGDISELMKQADIAMYQAKKEGKNILCFFEPSMQKDIIARADLEKDLRKAITENQFQLHYQIQINDKHKPIGAEALIRWFHPERGLISPFDFIPIAEETELIVPIGEWVIETACAQLAQWKECNNSQHLTMAVNVSAKQFQQVNFISQVKGALKKYQVSSHLLKIELTESLLLDDIDNTVTTMNVLSTLGVQFALDDFGTGYSSLQYLKQLPLFQLKIDQSFVRDLVEDSNDQAIVTTIISMARGLGLNVIAEGVETVEQQTMLEEKGCHYFQGYLIGKPVPIEQFNALNQQLSAD